MTCPSKTMGLRELRSTAGLTHADAARVLGSAESKIGRIENAQSGIRLPDLRALLDAYNMTDAQLRSEMEDLAREAKRKGWWSRYTNAVDSTYTAYAAAEWDAAAGRLVGGSRDADQGPRRTPPGAHT